MGSFKCHIDAAMLAEVVIHPSDQPWTHCRTTSKGWCRDHAAAPERGLLQEGDPSSQLTLGVLPSPLTGLCSVSMAGQRETWLGTRFFPSQVWLPPIVRKALLLVLHSALTFPFVREMTT